MPELDDALKTDDSRPPGRRLAAWCALRGWNLGEAAKRIGISRSTLSKTIRGDRPRVDILEKIQRYTGQPAADWFPGGRKT